MNKSSLRYSIENGILLLWEADCSEACIFVLLQENLALCREGV